MHARRARRARDGQGSGGTPSAVAVERAAAVGDDCVLCMLHAAAPRRATSLALALRTRLVVPAVARSVQFDTFSKRKYARVLQEAGGWAWFQELLRELRAVADKHDSTISNVATR